jgi:CheY-like chemotaxis protein
MSKTVLLVEDDELVREGLARTLKEKGLTVFEAADGKEGLEKALSGGVDLVVTDVIMPEVDGLTMLAKLREDQKGKDIPAIILSNDEQTESLNKALEAGVTAYMSKANLDAEAISQQILTALGET